MADQEDLRAVDRQGLVDLDQGLLRGCRGIGAVRHIGLEVSRCPPLRLPSLEGGRELVQGEGERRQVLGVDKAAATPGVVLSQGVREARALPHDDIALPAEQSADRH